MSDLIAITYDQEQTGRDAFNKLYNLQKMKLLELKEVILCQDDGG